MSWEELIAECSAGDLESRLRLPAKFTTHWAPTPEDRKAAWDLYTELRTRISVQPLHYLDGDEETALQSIADLFKLTRELLHKYGSPARQFSTVTVFVLNYVIRPFTAEWHKRKCAGELNNEDARHEFREALIKLQELLRQFGSILARLAEGEAFCADTESWPAATIPQEPAAIPAALQESQIPLQIVFDESVSAEEARRIEQAEREEIFRRRNESDNGEPPKDIAGLAISGGGIRSATFALGVVQRLAKGGVLSDFDYLSSVSGGGYLGSFLSTYLNSDTGTIGGQPIGLSPGNLPFRNSAVGESTPLRHIRGHSNYLFTGGLQNRMNMTLLAIHGVLVNLLIFLPILSGTLLAVAIFQGDVIRCLISQEEEFRLGKYLMNSTSQRVVALLMFAGLLTLAPIARLLRWSRKDELLLPYQIAVSVLLIGGMFVTSWNLIPPTFWLLDSLAVSGDTLNYEVAVDGGEAAKGEPKRLPWLQYFTFISGVVVVAQRLWASLDRAPAASKIKRFVSMTILGLIGPLFAFGLFLVLGELLIVQQPRIWGGKDDSVVLLAVLFLAPLIFVVTLVDINLSSLHPFYRRKLSQAFLIERTADPSIVRWNDGLRLSELRSNNLRAPYHLI